MSDSVFEQPSRRSFITIGGVASAASRSRRVHRRPAPAPRAQAAVPTHKLGVGNNGQVGKGRSGATGDTLLIAGFQWGAPPNFNPLPRPPPGRQQPT